VFHSNRIVAIAVGDESLGPEIGPDGILGVYTLGRRKLASLTRVGLKTSNKASNVAASEKNKVLE
jgi:hypothetical protein